MPVQASGGAKALFCYENHQSNGSDGGGAKPWKIFHLKAIPPVPPAGTCLGDSDCDDSSRVEINSPLLLNHLLIVSK